jgi:hypothetical protein
MASISLAYENVIMKFRAEELSSKLICFHLRRKGAPNIQPDNIYLQNAFDPTEVDIPDSKGYFQEAGRQGGSWSIRVSGEVEEGNMNV